MVETFGTKYETGRAEGEFLGWGTVKKYRLKWTNLKDQSESEYGGGHFSSKIWSEVRAQNEQKIVVQYIPAPFAAGFVTAVSNNKYAKDMYPSDPKVSAVDDVNPPSAGI